MKDWRAKVHKDANLFYGKYFVIIFPYHILIFWFIDMCKQYDFKPDLNLLHPYAHWITPEVRY